MARVTVEDCIDKVNDRFELVVVASQRAKNIAAGQPLTIGRNGEKNTVVALREIAAETVDVEDLREDVVKSYQRYHQAEDMPQGEDAPVGSGTETALIEEETLEAVAEEEELPESITEEVVEVEAERKAEGLSFEDENLDVDD